MDESKSRPFLESQWVGIGIGMIAGAIGSLLSIVWLVVAGWAIVCVEILRRSFFGIVGMYRWMVTVPICLLGSGILALTWQSIPKPKPPLTIGDIKSALPPTATSPPAKDDSQVATKDDIRKLYRELQNRPRRDDQQPDTNEATTKTTQPSPQVQQPPIDAQTAALKAVTSGWTKQVNDWADTRTQQIPQPSPIPGIPFQGTPEDAKRAQDFHDKIMQEWSQNYHPMAITFLAQYYRLNLLNGILNSCSGMNLGQGERGQLETFKRCAGYIQGAADKLQ